MPFSDPDGKHEIEVLIRRWVKAGDMVLDVGPGCGTYARMLKGTGVLMEGVEVFAPYIERFSLRSLYSVVHVADIRSFQPSQPYRLVILGDVLEHLSATDAQDVVQALSTKVPYGLLSVPWKYPQGEVDGNPAERHLQDDLTPAVMRERYPQLRCEYVGKVIGIYSWQPAQEAMTILIPTYARVRMLEEALWCALNQSERQKVLIFNDCPDQHLIFEHPDVQVVNTNVRCKALGDKRNQMLAMASTEWVTWLDDDDWLLPWHCQGLYEAAGHQDKRMVCPTAIWFATGGQLDGKVIWTQGGAPIVMALHRPTALQEGGCDADADGWEDQTIRKRLARHLLTVNTTPAYVYRWSNGSDHISASAPQIGAGVSFAQRAALRMQSGQEPSGEVILNPHLRFDYFKTLPPDIYARIRKHWGHLPPIYTGAQTVTVGGRSYQVKIPPGYRIGS